MIKAVIYDMDGLLIDSEPIWQKSEIEVFGDIGVTLTREMCIQTMGLRLDEVILHWYDRFRWENPDHKRLEKRIIDTVISYILKEGQALKGVHDSLEYFRKNKIPTALASSSCFKIIKNVVTHLGIKEYFSVIHSAEAEPYGKPHPAIYLTTAQLLNVAPVNCLAIEDSVNGLIAAKAARMKAVAIPDQDHFEDKRFGIADWKLRSLEELKGIDELNRLIY